MCEQVFESVIWSYESPVALCPILQYTLSMHRVGTTVSFLLLIFISKHNHNMYSTHFTWPSQKCTDLHECEWYLTTWTCTYSVLWTSLTVSLKDKIQLWVILDYRPLILLKVPAAHHSDNAHNHATKIYQPKCTCRYVFQWKYIHDT